MSIRRSMAAGLVAVCGAAAALTIPRGASPPPPPPSARYVAPGRLLTRTPYMGVACRIPNSIACDRVGLAVWLRRPAVAVTATIGGRRFALDDLHWSGPERRGARRELAGFLRPAGLRGGGPLAVVADGDDEWFGRRPVVATVGLEVQSAGGGRRWTRTRVPLSPGWG